MAPRSPWSGVTIPTSLPSPVVPHPPQRRPERGGVVPVRQVNHLMRHHVVHQPHGGLDDPPVEAQVALGIADTPTAALVAEQRHRRGPPIFLAQIAARSGRRIAAWCRYRATTASRTAAALPTGAVTTNRPLMSATLANAKWRTAVVFHASQQEPSTELAARPSEPSGPSDSYRSPTVSRLSRGRTVGDMDAPTVQCDRPTKRPMNPGRRTIRTVRTMFPVVAVARPGCPGSARRRPC